MHPTARHADRLSRCSAAALALALAPLAALSANGTIFTCTDAQGRRLTSDRPIAECSAREQRVLNRDGSLQRVIPPTLTADERSEAEAREQRRQAELKAQQEAVRRDRNLLHRFPDEAAHSKARGAALDDVRKAVQASETRLATLAAERKPLIAETEFYVGKKLPAALKQQLDANDAATEAQKALVQNQQAEIGRINALYDAELARLRQLWAGAQPGSSTSLNSAASQSTPRSARQ